MINKLINPFSKHFLLLSSFEIIEKSNEILRKHIKLQSNQVTYLGFVTIQDINCPKPWDFFPKKLDLVDIRIYVIR